ncbi:MAG: FxLYD domain-containing protein [Panacibacter sp.]
MQQYRLLRDNKETGPYAAEELIQSGLKKYDLVWVEGKSAAWRYPCEIDVFKPHVPAVDVNPFDRFYKKPSTSSAPQTGATITTTEMPTITTTTERKEKPRFKIKADCQKIETVVSTAPAASQETPVYNTNSYNLYTEPAKQPEPAKLNTTPPWENMWLDWEQEKKAVATASTVSSVVARIKALGGEEDEVLETKFSQSLDDIKERYVETILKKAKPNNRFEKYKSHLTAAVLLIAILAAGMWVGLKWSDKTGYVENKTPQQDIQLIPNETAVNESSIPDVQHDIDNNATEEPLIEKPQAENNQKPSAIIPVINRKINPVPNNRPKNILANKKAIVTNAINTSKASQYSNQPIQAEQKNYQPSVTDANGGRTAVKRDEPVNGSNTEATEQNSVVSHTGTIKRPVKKALAINDFVDVESYPVSSGVQYNVSNISDVPLDLVMIDLQYFDATGRYFKGETVYARNIQAGQSVKVNAPQNAKAAGIKYKVSMISSTQNDLNIIAD